MYNYIKGELTEINCNIFIVENNGLGYGVFMPKNTLVNIGDTVKIYTVEITKEDGLYLYGFVNQLQKEMFTKLLKVRGVGPRIAILILENATVDEIEKHIVIKNSLFFMNFKGIGKKVAEQIILDMKTKIDLTKKSTNNSTTQLTFIANDNIEKLKSVLNKMGFSISQIQGVVKQINKYNKIDDMLKESLIILREEKEELI